MKSESTLIIFAKAPVAGRVKTRLIPDMGEVKATILYKELLNRTLGTAIKTGISDIQLWISGNVRHQFFTNLKNRESFKFCKQTGRDLGERMFNAFDSVLKQHSYAVLIGSDCPELLYSDIQSAISLLKSGKELVLGPAEDGGYYLIGLKENKPALFSEIKWGEDNVFSETYTRAKNMNLDTALLSKRNDVDRAYDLHAYYKMKKLASTS